MNNKKERAKVRKMAKAKEYQSVQLKKIKKTALSIEIIGDSPLMLRAMSRYTERKLLFQYDHAKGYPLPEEFSQHDCSWEQLITSIHWLNPIEFHDENISLYSREEWERYMVENKPCILAQSFLKSFKEVVITFYKAEKIKGTDLRRALNVVDYLCPVEFANCIPRLKIVNTREDGTGDPVLMCTNVFEGWSTRLTVECPESVFPKESLLNIVCTAGEFIGIGSQRANGYGRYHIGNVETL